jgi:hypothetical protein
MRSRCPRTGLPFELAALVFWWCLLYPCFASAVLCRVVCKRTYSLWFASLSHLCRSHVVIVPVMQQWRQLYRVFGDSSCRDTCCKCVPPWPLPLLSVSHSLQTTLVCQLHFSFKRLTRDCDNSKCTNDKHEIVIKISEIVALRTTT